MSLRGKHDRSVPIQRRLERQRTIDPETGCWLWQGLRTKSGHGRINFKGKMIHVHRVAMHVYMGFDLGSSQLICHVRHCPNAHCFWPEHLYVGTQMENIADSTALGTHGRKV